MWLIFAFGSAFFAGITSILAKCGIKKTDSTVATAVRTITVLIFSWVMVFLTNSHSDNLRGVHWLAALLSAITAKAWIFLILSGLATGASWLCYFKALQLGDINKVVPIDKSSTILTIILALLFFQEPISFLKAAAIVLIGIGTVLMIQKKEMEVLPNATDRTSRGAESPFSLKGKSWLVYALLSALFASLTSILGKMGVQNIDSNLGTAIRTVIVLVMAWLMVFLTGKAHQLTRISKKELVFICLSGLATGGSWLCYYKALRDGPASVVVPVDKLSILITIAFSWIVFKEKLSRKALFGLLLIVAGTLLMIV